MPDTKDERFTHTDMDLMRARLNLTPGHRLQAMFAAYVPFLFE